MDHLLGTGLRAILALPAPLLRRIAGPVKINDRGDVLDLQLQALLRLGEVLRFPKTHELTPADARKAVEGQAALADPSPPVVEQVDHVTVPGPGGPIPIAIYTPRTADEALPVLVYYHGGGHTVGTLATYDGVCRSLAAEADCIVASVDYRLAPEYPFPAAIEDCSAAFERVIERAESLGGDPARVAVGGDSAGGNLAALVCLRRRETADQPLLQLLIYPALDLTCSMPSHQLFAQGFYLDTETKAWFVANYLGDGTDIAKDPVVSPLYADRLDGLPPAVIVTAGFDPLRDEGEAYSQRLSEAGVHVKHVSEPTLIHGFANMTVSREARAARIRIGQALRASLSTAPRSRPGAAYPSVSADSGRSA